MNFHDYLEKLRAKPVRERERVAIIVTAIGFFVFVAIWVVSLKEMNNSAEPQTDQTSASLNDLKTNFQDGKDSIQDMMQNLPSQTGAAGTDSANGVNNSGMDNSTGSAVPNPDGNLQNPSDNTNNYDGLQNIDSNPSAGNNSGAGLNDSQSVNSSNTDQNKPGVPRLP